MNGMLFARQLARQRMDSQVSKHRSSGPATFAGRELWLLRAGTPAALDACMSAFGDAALDIALAPPGGPEEAWAAALVHARRAARLVVDPALARRADTHAPAWTVLASHLAAHPRCLAVLELEVLLAAVACALDLDALDPERLHVARGHAVLLRGGPRGMELRRANVGGPERDPGMALPGGNEPR